MNRRSAPFLILALVGLAAAIFWLASHPGGDGVSTPPSHPPLDPVAPTESAESAESIWRALLAAVLSNEDPQGMHFLHWLARKESAPARGPALDATLDAWIERQHHGLLPVLRRYTPRVAELLAPRLEARSMPSLELVSMLLFAGGRRDAEAWKCEALRAAVVTLCERSGDLEADLDAGPRRTKALWVAGRARLREAIPAIKQAAGLAKGEDGRRLEADPYGSAMAVARKIIEENRAAARRGRQDYSPTMRRSGAVASPR